MTTAFPSAEMARIHPSSAFPIEDIDGERQKDKQLMAVNLVHTTIDPQTGQPRESVTDFNKKAIAQIAGAARNGVVLISNKTADAIAEIFEAQMLSNGRVVSAFLPSPLSDDGSYVPDFGPSLLASDVRAQVRALLAADPNGHRATALFDLCVKRRIQVSFVGESRCPAHIQAVNAPADNVEIIRSAANMSDMLAKLGLGHTDQVNRSEMIPLGLFKRAVEVLGATTDMPQRLKAFIACADRNSATHVYWE